MSDIRYELLQRGPVVPDIHHKSVGRVLIEALRQAPDVEVDLASYIPKSFHRIFDRNIVLGWGSAVDIRSGEAREFYVVERRTPGPFFVVRERDFDGAMHPLKSDYRIVEHTLTFFEGLIVRKVLSEQDNTKFYDVFPQTEFNNWEDA